MIFKMFDKLCDDAKKIRTEVFVNEQGFSVEFDNIDDIAFHLVGYDEGVPAAVCRYYYDNEHKSYMIGRIAVKKEYRGKHYGNEILSFAEKQIAAAGGTDVALSAQVRASEFYEKNGYIKEGGEYYDEYCPHILMRKKLYEV